MAAQVKVGCAQAQVGGSKYWANFGFYELPGDAIGGVKPKTLARYRAEAPDGSEFVVTVSPDVAAAGFLGEQAQSAWLETMAVAKALNAGQVLLKTPPAFRPTRSNRDALTQFVSDRRDDVSRIVWLPEGLWESQPDDVNGVCADTGLVPVCDPLGLEDLEDIPRGEIFYWRLLGRRGLRSGFSDYELDMLMELVLTRREGHISFSSPNMFGEARRFSALLREELAVMDDD